MTRTLYPLAMIGSIGLAESLAKKDVEIAAIVAAACCQTLTEATSSRYHDALPNRPGK